jgi:hypothetical protein
LPAGNTIDAFPSLITVPPAAAATAANTAGELATGADDDNDAADANVIGGALDKVANDVVELVEARETRPDNAAGELATGADDDNEAAEANVNGTGVAIVNGVVLLAAI